MSAPARRRRRAEELSSQTLVRRSPRLTKRLSQLVDSSTHPLHQFQVSSRVSLGGHSGGRGGRRSVSPNTILNESGQSVPVAFEDDGPSHHRAGEPRHLYGLDTDEVEIEYSGSSAGPTQWNIYDKNRVPVSHSPRHSTPYRVREENPGVLASVYQLFSSLLFKLGSFLYLAAAAILCLDVIVLHRLFNFSSVSQRSSSIIRFFLLLLALFALIVLLLGGHFIPFGSKEEYRERVNISDAHLKSLLTDIVQSLEQKMSTDMDSFEARFKRDLDTRINSIVQGSTTKLSFDLKDELRVESEKQNQALLRLREELISELGNFRQRQFSELKNSMESQLSGVPVRLDELKNSLEPQISDLRESQNDLLDSVRQKFDAFAQKHEGLLSNMTTLRLYLDRQDNRISILEERLGELATEMVTLKSNYLHRLSSVNQSLSEEMVVEIFNQELEKATADKGSALRLWLDLVFASKNDLQNVHQRIDDLHTQIINAPAGGYGDLTRKDVEDMIALALRRYSADRIAKFDFALESSGGCVILEECSPTYAHTMTSVSLLGVIPLWHYMSTPKVIIQPSMYPGDCWAMEGQQGYATVKLRSEVIIDSVTVDHIPQELAPNGTGSLDTTPKDFKVQGFTALNEESVELGQFSYNLNGSPIQTFNIVETAQQSPFKFVRFQFLSNYGNENYTCIYRVRVHGRYP